MDFTWALRSALEARGNIALSLVIRHCEADGMHNQGDIREVVSLQLWEAAYFFPPCFQPLRGNEGE